MMNIFIFHSLLLFHLVLAADSFLPACNDDGRFLFSNTAADIVLNDYQGTVSPCKYYNAPNIIFTGTRTNVTFMSLMEMYNQRGSLIFDDGARATFHQGLSMTSTRTTKPYPDLLIVKASSVIYLPKGYSSFQSKNGNLVSLLSNGRVSCNNCTFEGKSLLPPSSIFISTGSEFNCTNCHTRRSTVTVSGSGTRLLWDQGSCINTTSCVKTEIEANSEISNIQVSNVVSSKDELEFLFSVEDKSKALLRSITVDADSSLDDSKRCIKITGASVSFIESSTFRQCWPFSRVQESSTITISSSNVIGAQAHYSSFSNVMHGIFLSNHSEAFIKNGSRFSGMYGTMGGVISIRQDSFARCEGDSVFEWNGATYGGAVYIEQGGTFTSDGCQFIGNLATVKGGAISCDGGILHIGDNSVFISNRAYVKGGAISIDVSGSQVSVTGKIKLFSNIARDLKKVIQDGRGGFISISGNGHEIKLNDTIIEHANNQAPRGSFMDLEGNSTKFQGETKLNSSSANAKGAIFVADFMYAKSLASRMQDNIISKTFPGLSLHSIPVGIHVLHPNSTTKYFANATIPSIRVAIVDIFNQTQTWVGRNSLIQVHLVDPSNAIKFTSGDERKAMLDQERGIVEFSNLTIKNTVVRNYQLRVVASGFAEEVNAPKETSLTSWPQLTFGFKTCDPELERPNPNAKVNNILCLPVRVIDKNARAAFTGIGGLGVALALALLTLLIMRRNETVIREHSTSFHAIIVIGVIFAFSSLILGGQAQIFIFRNCNSMYWLENMGFVLVLGSLYAKAFRLQKFLVFTESEQDSASWSVGRLDKLLVKWLLVIVLVMIGYLTFWHAFYPSDLTETFINDKYVVMDRCEPGVFGKCMFYVKIMVELAFIVFCHNISKGREGAWIPEDKILLFLSYIWFLFGGLMGLFGQWNSTTEVDVEFIMKSSSIFLPHFITLVSLVALKIARVKKSGGGNSHNLKKITNDNNVQVKPVEITSTNSNQNQQIASIQVTSLSEEEIRKQHQKKPTSTKKPSLNNNIL